MASAQELIRSLHLEEGVSEKDIAKRLGLSVQAVRDVLEQPPPRRPHQLDPFRDQILNLLRSDRGATVKRVGALVGPKGAELSERDVRKYVAELRKTVETAPEAPEPAEARTPPHPDPLPTPGPDGTHDFQSPDYFLNRELTWLNFNFRVLHEAEDERTPLLDRIKFISIVGSNLDEFFMKRIGGLKQQVGAGLHDLTVDGRTPQQQIDECHQVVRELEARKREALQQVMRALEEEGVVLTSYEALGAEDRDYLRQYYFDNIYPLVTPQATDPAHPFPFISNLSLNLLVTLRHAKDDEPLLARVKVPVGAGIPRMLKVRDRHTFVPMESVMANNLDLLFPGMVIDSCVHFRVTRNANTELDEDKADDLLAMIETEMRERKFAPIVRLEATKGIEPHHRGMIAAELGLDEAADVYEKDELLGMRDLMELKAHPELQALQKPALHDPPHHPVDHPLVSTDRNVFHVIRDVGSVLLQHPYESFTTSVERFLMEASRDPKVRAIKMCLYRTSAESKALDYLIDAARNGKQVAVVVELKARFDEEANIRWASRLENVGIHVTYGVVGLKTHCKVIQVVRQDHDGLRRYAHVGTGNY
ncbi:MAG: polyphosphate kinase 1, partial [Planctomycetota bacterium]